MEIFEQWESEIRGYSRAYPTVFASASNARQVDEAGKSYIDFFAGAGVLNFGHNNPHMKQAIIEGSDVTELDMSCFTGEYVTGTITEEYLSWVETNQAS